MFTNEGPIAAANVLQDYLIFNMAGVPAEALPKLQEVARERSPADILVKGSELLYAALIQCPDMPNPQDAWNAVGVAALQVAHSNLWARGERSFAVMTFANFKVNGTVENMPEPEAPAVDNEYRVIPKTPEELQAEAMANSPDGMMPPVPAPAQPTAPAETPSETGQGWGQGDEPPPAG